MRCMKMVCSVIIFLTYCTSFAQNYSSKILKVKGEFVHKAGVRIPAEINGFTRTEIRSFDKANKHLSIAYDKMYEGEPMKVSVFIYPSEQTDTYSLQQEYYNSLYAIGIKENQNLLVKPKVLAFKGNGLTLHGLGGITYTEKEGVSVYECGKWLLKIRISAKVLSEEQFDEVQNTFIEVLDPTILVKANPWNPASFKIAIDRKILADSLFAMCVLLGAYAHTAWMENKVDLNERKAGVPGLYLRGYYGAFKIIVTAWEKVENKSLSKMADFLNELKLIDQNGFLNEYIMEQHHHFLIVPEDSTLNFDKFKEWKSKTPLNFNLSQHYYTIMYTK